MRLLKQNTLAEATTELGFVESINSNIEDSGFGNKIALQREVTLEDGTIVTIESVTPEKMMNILNTNSSITGSSNLIDFITPGEQTEVYEHPEEIGPIETIILDGVVQITNNTSDDNNSPEL